MNHSASTDVNQRDGVICSSDEAAAMAVERRDYVIQSCLVANQLLGGAVK